MEIINGREISDRILAELKSKIINLNIKPKLAIIYVGNNEASKTYIEKKKEAGKFVGIDVDVYSFINSNDDEISNLIKKLGSDNSVNGIILQLPAPLINLDKVLPLIPINKDVDGLNPLTIGNIMHGNMNIVPATVRGILKVFEYISEKENVLLKDYLKGKNVLIINRSLIIGKPLSALLLNYNSTVTIAHSYTNNINELLPNIDILITGIGKNINLDLSILKDGVVVIDAGFNKKGENINGDIDINIINDRIKYLSPVPNGIGPLGVSYLLLNTYHCYSLMH